MTDTNTTHDAGDVSRATALELQPLTFQRRTNEWAVACFGEAIASDKTERTHRFMEEALELAQACGCTKGEALQLVDYVFARDQGDVAAEVGDVMNTVAMLCTAHGIDMDAAGHKGLDRCWENIAKTRAKRAAKPAVSPLPVVDKPITERDAARVLLDAHAVVCAKGWKDCTEAERDIFIMEVTALRAIAGQDGAK